MQQIQHSAPAADSTDSAAWAAWAEKWCKWDPNCITANEVRQHIQGAADGDNAKLSELRGLLGSRLEFGTAGLRGPMGAGSCRMNDLVVIQSTQGVCCYLEQVFGPEGRKRGICIGFDHRSGHGCNSESMALYAAAVSLHAGFQVYFYTSVTATPFVPWCIEQKGCVAGIMITASHNPAADNGYKLYWENGAQIIPPHDTCIADLILANLEPWAAYDTTQLSNNPALSLLSPGSQVELDYFSALEDLCLHKATNMELEKAYPITYTAMHGVGHRFVSKAWDAFGHGSASLVGVEAQLQPDPAFPTVAFPNPEEGKGALKLAIEAAEKAGSSLILANDPDADRLAVAERTASGTWHVFTGNELGCLLGHWAWVCWRKQNPDADPGKVFMIASTVSSKFLETVAKNEGFNFVETLTGFKWMGSKAAEIRNAGGTAIFAFEEAIGFCFGGMVKDKDGISAAAVFAEMAKQLFKEGRTCLQHLHALYEKYGFFISLNSYVKSHDSALTRAVFAKQRGPADGARSYCKTLGEAGEFEVTAVRDLTIGFDSRSADGKPTLPLNLGGEMITYYFDTLETQVTLRTSGTEPKIKFYSEMRSATGDEDAQKKLQDLVCAVVKTLLDPVGNGLEIRPEDLEWLA